MALKMSLLQVTKRWLFHEAALSDERKDFTRKCSLPHSPQHDIVSSILKFQFNAETELTLEQPYIAASQPFNVVTFTVCSKPETWQLYGAMRHYGCSI
jgi:hypothetical protein